MSFNTCIDYHYYHHKQDTKQFQDPADLPFTIPLKPVSFPILNLLVFTDIFFLHIVLPFVEYCLNGIIVYVISCV